MLSNPDFSRRNIKWKQSTTETDETTRLNNQGTRMIKALRPIFYKDKHPLINKKKQWMAREEQEMPRGTRILKAKKPFYGKDRHKLVTYKMKWIQRCT